MKRISFVVFFLWLPFAVQAQMIKEITVAVAANVQFPFEELRKDFKQETGIELRSVIGSSGQLSAQIQNGAPFDVFLSADMDYPQKLHDKGLVIDGPEVYAFGTLVLWTASNKPEKFFNSIDGLLNAQVEKIAIASPDAAPYGRQSVNVLKYYGILSKIKEKIVYGQSLAQVNQFVLSGSTQVGFTAKAVVLAMPAEKRGQWMEIDRESYKPMPQGVVILKHASKEKRDWARAFYQFLFSDKARDIFEKYGYQLPQRNES